MLSTNSTALYFYRFSWVSGYFSSAGIAAVSILTGCSMDIRNRELGIFIYSVILWRIVWTRGTFYVRQSSCLYDFKKNKNLREKNSKKANEKYSDSWCGSLCSQTDFSGLWLYSGRGRFYLRILQMVICHRANSRSLRHRYNCFPDRGLTGAEVSPLSICDEIEKPGSEM